VEEELQWRWSPQQIAGWLRRIYRCPPSAPACHWEKRLGSVAYTKTSEAGRSISALVTIAVISAPIRQQVGEASHAERPSFVAVDTIEDGLPAGDVVVEVAVLEFHAGALRRVWEEPNLRSVPRQDLIGRFSCSSHSPVQPNRPPQTHGIFGRSGSLRAGGGAARAAWSGRARVSIRRSYGKEMVKRG
jgi:hypothetical protein